MFRDRQPFPHPPALLTALLGAAVLLAALPTAPVQAASLDQLQQQITSGQGQISQLSGALGTASARLSALDGSVAAVQARIARVQADLDTKRRRLMRVRDQLNAARTRLLALERFQARAERALSGQLLDAYKSDNPDLVSVVLEARGFKDLLERLSFTALIRRQSARVVTQVRTARRAVSEQAVRLGALEEHQQTLTVQVLQQRDALARDRVALVSQQLVAAQDRRAKAGRLASVRARVAALQGRLTTLQAAQRAAAAAAARSSAASLSAGAAGRASSGGAPVSAGGFAFPLPKGSGSPPGSWSLDQGVDISAPGDTPEYAVCSGTIVLHGIGGFGPWAPVLHCDSALGGYSYVYYGHSGPANQLPVGSHLSSGQVMSEVGPGIVGMSTGPHLEIGFADASGTPVGGGSASAMMSLLQGSY